MMTSVDIFNIKNVIQTKFSSSEANMINESIYSQIFDYNLHHPNGLDDFSAFFRLQM